MRGIYKEIVLCPWNIRKRLTAVNWNVAKRILITWILTIPASALVAYLAYQVMSPLLGK